MARYLVRQNGTGTVDGLSQCIDDTTDEGLTDGDGNDTTGPAGQRLAFA